MHPLRRLTIRRRQLVFRREPIQGQQLAWVERPGTNQVSGQAVLVLIPGLSMSWRAYSWLLDELPSDRTVLIVDPPGSGRSKSLPVTMGADSQAHQIASWLGHLELTGAEVVGHSMGAIIAARLAAQRPDLVSALTMVSPSPDARLPHFHQHVWAMIRGAGGETPRTFVQAATDYVRASPRVLTGFASDLRTDASVVMKGVSSPVIVVRGTEDKVSSRAWCTALANASGGEVITVPDAAHGLPQQAPATLARVLNLPAQNGRRASRRSPSAEGHDDGCRH